MSDRETEEIMVGVRGLDDRVDLVVELREWALWQDSSYPIFMADVPSRQPTQTERPPQVAWAEPGDPLD